jgi:hypothetical protein
VLGSSYVDTRPSRLIDENDEITAIRSRISLILSKITSGSGLELVFVIVMTRLTQDIKFMPLLVF